MKLHRINALLLKYYYISINRFDRIFDLFYWPLLDIIIWGFMSVYVQKISDVNLLSMIMGGIILWVFVWRSSQDIAVFVLEDFWTKNLYNLYSSPLKISEMIASLMIWGFLRSMITFAFLASVAIIFYSMNIFSIGIVLLTFFAFALLVFAWALGLIIASAVMRWGARIQVLAWSVVWIVQPFSCVFYPLEALPLWAQKVSFFFPTTHIFEGMRAALSGGVVNYGNLGFALLFSFIAFILTSLLFGASVKKARKTGLLAKAE
jgi:ABC-2 type transport system permease protein